MWPERCVVSWAFPAGAREAVPRDLERFRRNPAGFALGTPPWGRRVKIPPERPMGGGFRECPRSGVETTGFPCVFLWNWGGPGAPRVRFSGCDPPWGRRGKIRPKRLVGGPDRHHGRSWVHIVDFRCVSR